MKTKEQIIEEFHRNLAERNRLEAEIEANIYKDKEYHKAVINYLFAPNEVCCPIVYALMELSKISQDEK